MKRQFLEELGLEAKVIDKILAENGADVDNAKAALTEQINGLQAQVTQRDTDLTALNEKLTAAQADAGKLTEAQTALTDLQSKYDTERREWEEKTARHAYEFLVRERANGLKFSSGAAKKEFIREAIGKQFQVDGESLLGFDDYVSKYRETDPGAFQNEKSEADSQVPPKPDIVLPPTGAKPTPDGSGFNFRFPGVRPMPQNQ